MARTDGFTVAAAGVLSALLCVALAHPPSAPGGSGTRQLQWDRQPWLRLVGEEFDGFGSVPDEWSFGFGRRLSLIERRQGSVQQQQQQHHQPPEPAIEASTKLITVTRQLRPKPAEESRPETSSASGHLARKRLPVNRPAISPLNSTQPSAPVVVAHVPANQTTQAAVPSVELDPDDELDAEESITSPTVVEPAEPAEEKVEQSSSTTSTSTTTTTTSTTVATTTTTTGTTTTTTTPPPPTPKTSTTERTTASINLTSSVPVKPLWRIRMEQNQNIRRQQLASTSKPDSGESSAPSDVASSTPSVKSTTVEFVPLRAFNLTDASSVAPPIEPSQVDVSIRAPSIASTATNTATVLRPIQSTRVSAASSGPTSSTTAPVTRPHLTTTRVSPSLPPKLIVTTSRQPVAVVPTVEASVRETQADEENSVKNAVLARGAASSPVAVPSTASGSTSTTTMTTTTATASATSRPSSTTRKPPTPVVHSLEDILQRLVPTRDDSYHNNPYLASPTNQGGARIPILVPAAKEEVNEIVAEVRVNQRSGASAGQRTNANGTSNSSQGNGDPSETQQATTSIYIVGIVAVIPLAGVILWVLRVHLHKRRERLNESETSSETGFRKRLPPVALTPSKHGRLFYGQGDKEDLVPGASGQSGSGSGSKMSSGASSPWEFTRSRLRLQTLIGEGNFGQVWKAEAEDICGCQGTLLVAVKTVKDGATNKEKQELLREMKIMQQLGPHPNVVALLGCCTEQEPFLLIMEYVMYGRLLTFLRDHRTHQTYYNYSSDSEALTSRDLTTFAYCVAKGMEYIYSKGIVHRDLAARNVLVDHNKLCKVADFGLSRNVRDSAGEMYEQRVKGALPIRWMAPESLIQSVFTQKSDVWSFGILVWEIVTLGSTPYPGMEAREVMRRVKDGHRLERPSHCRPEFYRLMSRCWHSDPQRRPDFSELKTELGRLLDDADGYIDLDNFQDSGFPPLESPSDESEKV